MSVFDEPFLIGSGPHRVSASLGIAVGEHGDNADVLLRNADLAMYRAKARNHGGSEIFDDEMRRRVQRELLLEDALAKALDAGDLELHYQPIVSLATGGLLSLEALLRWSHPQLGPVSPSEVIPLAEANGMIVELGWYVLRRGRQTNGRLERRVPRGRILSRSP